MTTVRSRVPYLARAEHPVVIIGAGPVGLTAAARLSSLGVGSILLEKNSGLVQKGSKACLIQGDALETLDKFGSAEQIAREGVTWTVGHTYVRGREIATARHPRRLGPGPFVNISQSRIEQLVLARVTQDPACVVRWGHRVIRLEQRPDCVLVTATGDGGRSWTISCEYVVACDGARSQVRDMLAVPWLGYRHADQFLITDVKVRLPLPKHRHFHYDAPFNPGRQVVLHPQPDDVWRIDIQLPAGGLAGRSHAEGQEIPAEVQKHVKAVVGDRPFEVIWWSTYGFHQRIAERFRVQRVFLAGDAAHTFPPYGSRGMNSGIQDVDNLSWKLAFVLTGRSGDRLLETYHEERHAAAVENLAVTEATLQFMVPPTRRAKFRRDAILRVAALPENRLSRMARRRVDSGRMARPFRYRDSSLIEESPSQSLVGEFAPDAAVTTPHGGPRRLREFFGQKPVALYVGSDEVCQARFLATTEANETTDRVLLAPEDCSPSGDRWTAVLKADLAQIDDGYRLAPTEGLLVRPDGHVAASFDVAIGPDAFADLVSRTHGTLSRTCHGPSTSQRSKGDPRT